MDESDSVIRAILFDMDGVIVDSERYWKREQRERIFPKTLDGAQPDLSETTGMNYREIYDYLDENYETTLGRSEFVDVFDETARTIYTERVSLLDGFHDLLDDLAARDVPVAIVSSSPPSWIEIVTDRFDFEVDEIVSGDELDAPGKPEPDIFEAAAAAFDRNPGECLVVEDSANGSIAAARAGTFVVGYRTDVNAETDLSTADVVVDGPDALRDVVFSHVGSR